MNPTQQLIDPAALYSDEATEAFLGVVNRRLENRHKRLLSEREQLVRAWRIRSEMSTACLDEAASRRARGELDAVLAQQTGARRPAHREFPTIGPLVVPTTQSCVTPPAYFQWQSSSGVHEGLFHRGLLTSPDEFSSIVDTDSPRTISARVQLGANADTLTALTTVGTTGWVQLGRRGLASLNVQVFFNAKDTVFTAVFGGGEGRITLGVFVAEVLNLGAVREGGRWVPEIVEVPDGVRELLLADGVYESFPDLEEQDRTLELEFMGQPGGVYACSFFVEVFSTTTGLCWSMVDFEGVVDPFDVCQ